MKNKEQISFRVPDKKKNLFRLHLDVSYFIPMLNSREHSVSTPYLAHSFDVWNKERPVQDLVSQLIYKQKFDQQTKFKTIQEQSNYSNKKTVA